MEKRLAHFLRLTALELIVSGILCTVIAVVQSQRFLLIASPFAVIGGGFLLWLASRSAILNHDATASLLSRFGNGIPFLPLIALSLFFFGFKPSQSLTVVLSPLLVCLWLIGVQAVWALGRSGEQEPVLGPERSGVLSFVSLALAAGILLLPSRTPSLLNGIPLDHPFEFVTAALFLPLGWIINKHFFSDKRVVIILAVLFLIKLSASFFLPQSGLAVRIYANPSSGDWKRSYTTWLAPDFTVVMQAPYTRMREFPVEWVNERSGFDFASFWMMLEVHGVVDIYDEGRFALVARGARQMNIEMTPVDGGSAIPVFFVDSPQVLDAELYQGLPDIHAFELRGTIVYPRFGEARFEPVLLYPDGSFRSLFGHAGVWVPRGNILSQSQSLFFGFLLNWAAVVFFAALFISLISGTAHLYSQNRLSLADVYLAVSGFSFYYLATLVEKPGMPFLLVIVLALVAVVKILDLKFAPSTPGFKSYLLFMGTIFLLCYLALDIDSLRSIAILPEAQDGLEYQTFARQIFVEGDVFLRENPPRAYKVLFPYVAGTLHVLFGQSTAAQFFLNAWCAALSAALTFVLAQRFRLPMRNALLSSVSFLIILCLPSSYIYYFRFGLIEPVAVFCLLAASFFALERRMNFMVLAGVLTVLFRLDYLGLALAAMILTADPITGGFKSAWTRFFDWLRQNIGGIAAYSLKVILPSALVIAGYFIFIPGYVLNASDTAQASLHTMLEGFMRVLFGGSFNEFQKNLLQNSHDFFLIVLPLAAGFAISMLSIFYRRGIFAKIDLRLALLVPSILPAYIVVRPAAYFPRFSFPILALDILLIGMLLHHLRHRSSPHNHDINDVAP